ncbi:MAG TPA: putative toxin-antitoxin system toxin component, PIN family [Anaeromyxobacteraceae bacterium]|nr:putative toxin-antitoxin system toxin component, PIN family [Anaeromyxobacteraceae bacterium]
MIRAVLDANVVVAAMLAPHGVPARVVAAANVGYELVWSPAIVAECLRVISYPKLRTRFRVGDPRAFIAHLARVAVLVESELPVLGAVRGDPADDVHLATALVGAARRLVTGDRRHLVSLGHYAGVRIVTPAEFLRELEGPGSR